MNKRLYSRGLFWLVFVAIAVTSSSVWAQTRRFAVVIGSNQGDDDETPLRYAERDARRMADVLLQMGDVKRDDLVLLLGSNAQTVELTLRSMSESLRETPAQDTMLFVFFSGHADQNAIHLGGTRLALNRMRTLLDTSPADLRVLVLDACRSGEVTRVKGGRPAAPFKLESDDWDVGQGLAIITSAASGEDAQESERLRGSFFTHYFVSALMGAADVSKDGRVTLSEAYDYTYKETIRATSRASFVQHPTYSFDLRGRRDLVMTRLVQNEGQGTLYIVEPGSYVLFENDDEGDIVAEVRVDSRAEVMLPEGYYFVRRRQAGKLWEGYAAVLDSDETLVRDQDLDPVPMGRVARKGGYDDSTFALGFVAAGGASAEVLDDTSPMGLGMLGLQLDTRTISFQLRAKYAGTASSNTRLAMRQDVVGLDLAAMSIFDFGSFFVGGGLRIGGDLFFQTFDDEAIDARQSVVGRAGGLINAGWAITPWWTLYIEPSAEVHLTSVADPEQSESREFKLVPAGVAGFVFYL